MSTTTINQPAKTGGAKAQGNQPITIALIREKLTTSPGKYILFGVQFLLSLFTVFYLRGIILFAYNSIFYRLEIPELTAKSYCFSVSVTCFEYALLMLFTRRQIVTRLVILCAMPFYFPIFLFNYQRLELIIPLSILIVVTFLASGTSEGPKTILGAVFLMFYIIGAVVFFVVQSILTPTVSDTVIKRDLSPLGNYRYEVVQEIDRADGCTYIAIEPNDADIKYERSVWHVKGFKKTIYHARPLDTCTYEWSTQERSLITQTLLAINPDTTFTLNADQMRILGLDAGFTKEYEADDLTRMQLRKLGYQLKGDKIIQLLEKVLRDDLMEIDKDRILRFNFDQMVSLGLNPTYDIKLADLTDEDLEKLGVPEETEILRMNGKVVFRQYIAVLEDTFDVSNRELTALVQSNELPEVDPKGVDLEEVRRKREEAAKATETTTTATETTTANTDTTDITGGDTTETTAAAAQ